MTKFNKDMYLRRIKFKKYSKYLYLGSLIIILGAMFIYFTYSKYSVFKDTEVVRTTVGDFLYGDIVVGAYINGEYSKDIPGKSDGYKIEKIACDNGATGAWNNETWGLAVTNLSKRTKCNLYFISDINVNFNYTGSEQTFIVPVSGTYKLETWGAQGGDANENYPGGYGGYATGEVFLSKDLVLYINVGSEGNVCTTATSCIGGYNGGGGGKAYTDETSKAAGGGGATHIATKSGLLSSLENDKSNILIVAGGGGGGNYTNHSNGGIGGHAGGYVGNDGTDYLSDNQDASGRTSYGGTQEKAGCNGAKRDCGSFGLGATSAMTEYHEAAGSGGGGGYYGGGAANIGPGAGGSSYISNSSLNNKAMYCYNCKESSEVSTKTISTTCSETLSRVVCKFL